MRDKYWAKKKYSQVDPVDYTLQRFSTPAGKLIDEAEKRAVLDLLQHSGREYKKELKILDVATGPGRLAFYLAEHLRDAKITGMDINENMLRRAREIARGKNVNINFIRGDIYQLPFKENQFDAVAGLRFSMHLPDLDKVLNEITRVLKVGGILVFDILNLNSILHLKCLNRKGKITYLGFYTKQEIVTKANKYGLEFLSEKGILLFGETILRFLPHQVLNFVGPMINSPFLFKNISSKLVLSFRKNT